MGVMGKTMFFPKKDILLVVYRKNMTSPITPITVFLSIYCKLASREVRVVFMLFYDPSPFQHDPSPLPHEMNFITSIVIPDPTQIS